MITEFEKKLKERAERKKEKDDNRRKEMEENKKKEKEGSKRNDKKDRDESKKKDKDDSKRKSSSKHGSGSDDTSKKTKSDSDHQFKIPKIPKSSKEPKLTADYIIGAAEDEESNEVMFIVKWKGIEKAELVPAKEANIKIPQTVIKFYEGRVQWDKEDGRDK